MTTHHTKAEAPVPNPSIPLLLGLGNVLHRLLISNNHQPKVAINKPNELPAVLPPPPLLIKPPNLLQTIKHDQIKQQQQAEVHRFLRPHPKTVSGGGLAGLLKKILGIGNNPNLAVASLLPQNQRKKLTLLGRKLSKPNKSNLKLSLTLFGGSNKKVGLLNQISNHPKPPPLLFNGGLNNNKQNIFAKIRSENQRKILQRIQTHNERKQLLKNEKILLRRQQRINKKRQRVKPKLNSINQQKMAIASQSDNQKRYAKIIKSSSKKISKVKSNQHIKNISKTITNTTAMISELKMGLKDLLHNVENGNGPIPLSFLSKEHIPSTITLHFKDPLGEQNTMVNLVIRIVPHYEEMPQQPPK